MRSACATSMRDMMVDNIEARLKFLTLGGTQGLVNQLHAPHDPSLNQADVQLEAVLNIQDFVEDDDGNIIPDIAKEVIRCGGTEVRESVVEVLQSLDEFESA